MERQRTRIILIVGSNAKERAKLRRYLSEDEEFEYIFSEEETIENSLAACLKKEPHCILIDSDNLENLSELACRLLESAFPVVFITKESDSYDRISAIRKNSNDSFLKGAFSPAQLCRSVQIAIGKFAARQVPQTYQEALIKAERRAAEDYQALLARIVPLGQALGTARDLTSVYRAVFEFACSSMACSAFFISFYNSETKLRTAAYAWGEGEEIDIENLPPMHITETGGTNSQAILNKKTVITNRYMDTIRNRPHVVLQDNGIEPMSSLVVPMITKNGVVGTLEVQAHENEAYKREQAVVLEMAASLAAVAIENVRLLDIEAKARQEAEDANRAKDEFLTMVTHEIRSPLNAILGWARILANAKEFEPVQTARAVEVIKRSGEMQKILIDDLLDSARIISGKLQLNVQPLELRALLESALDTIRPAANAKNIEINFIYDLEQETISADSERLQQIIWNLLANAIKFTPVEGVITLRASHYDSFIRLTVADTGKGIEPDILPYIFNRFIQAESAGGTHRHSGLGLGLSLVRYLVELHGGSCTAESAGIDCGATFTVDLPNLLAERGVFE